MFSIIKNVFKSTEQKKEIINESLFDTFKEQGICDIIMSYKDDVDKIDYRIYMAYKSDKKLIDEIYKRYPQVYVPRWNITMPYSFDDFVGNITVIQGYRTNWINTMNISTEKIRGAALDYKLCEEMWILRHRSEYKKLNTKLKNKWSWLLCRIELTVSNEEMKISFNQSMIDLCDKGIIEYTQRNEETINNFNGHAAEYIFNKMRNLYIHSFE